MTNYLILKLLENRRIHMHRSLSVLIGILTLFIFTASAQNQNGRAEDEKAISNVIRNIEDAWAAGDATRFADNFADDVDYTVWNGYRLYGRQDNVREHQAIFDTIYKNTQMKAEIVKIRFLTDDVAAVQAKSKLYRNGKPLDNVPTVVPLLVFQKMNGIWKVAVLQNTPMIKQGELVVGRTVEKPANN